VSGADHIERWHRAYASGRRWGDEPGELARLVAAWLPSVPGSSPSRRLLDVGCGYGRDAVFLSGEVGLRVVGIDPAAAGIALARETAPAGLIGGVEPRLEYRVQSIEDVDDGPFDAVFVSNVYHVLPEEARATLRTRAFDLLHPGGLLLLSTLAVGDPEHWGTGDHRQSADGPLDTHLYFSTEESVRREFAAFEIVRLLRHEFVEPQTTGPDHRHIHMVLIARRPAG
jgi:SAM-dependent methyltransferase